MRKRILSLALALTLLLCAAPIPASAAGSLEGVDYTRIEQNSSLEKEVTFLIGDREFTGTLSNGKTLTDEEVDEIIRGVMTSKKITSGMLIGAQQRASDGLRYNEDRYVQPTVFVEYALASADIASAQELSQIISGDKPIPTNAQFYADLLADTAINKLFDIALGALTGETASKYISALQNILEIGGREYDEYAADEERVLQSLAAAMALEEFYSLCNAEIKKAEKERGLNQWSLTCAQTVWTKRNLFGSLPVTQYWRLYCDLDRTHAVEDVTNWGGTYTGTMKLDIWHDMESFDEKYLDDFYLPAMPYGSVGESLYDFEDEYPSTTSKLTKTVENKKFSIVLDPGMAEGGEFTKPFSFNGFEDDTFFWSIHSIHLYAGDDFMSGFGYTQQDEDTWGANMFGQEMTASLDVTSHMTGEVAAGGRGIKIVEFSYNHLQQGTQDGAMVYDIDPEAPAGAFADFATDTTVFEDLRIVPTITISGV